MGIKKKQYCILNKQYTREEYAKLRQEIIEQMCATPYIDGAGRIYRYGEFFPPELSPFAYNESFAQHEFPLTKEAAVSLGYLWRASAHSQIQPTKNVGDIPSDINNVSDGVLEDIIECSACHRGFRVIKSEIDFYREQKVPIPGMCFFCRLTRRSKKKNPMKLWPRQCMCDGSVYKNSAPHAHHPNGRCHNKFETSFSPDRPEIVYCEECYQQEVV